MAWIKTVPIDQADEKLLKLLEAQREYYPAEYGQGPTVGATKGEKPAPGIVASHTLIPEALFHAFSTFGVLMSPDLPLERRQHEMIATIVSVTNQCHY
ncbi:MAG TPA: hypothetical protein VFW40_04615 [Capsulimonadaceae bacterium]|nr:hypothetical protein [Capsulimonadaceae bacterium]